MAEITIMDGINIKAQIRKLLNEKRSQRNELSIYKSETQSDSKTNDVYILTNEIDDLIFDITNLSGLIADANANAKITLPGSDKQVSLSEAMTIVKEWRDEIPELQKLSNISSVPKLSIGYKQNYYESATFDPTEYKKRVDNLIMTANSLSRAIDRANDNFTFDFPNANKYLIVQ